MTREEAFAVLKRRGSVTHPVLIKAGIGPLYLENDVVYGPYGQPINAKWRTKIDSKLFNDGWIECD